MLNLIRFGTFFSLLSLCLAAVGDGRFIPLGSDLGAWGMGPDGTVVGARGFQTYDEAMKWTESGGPVLLGFAPGVQWSEAFAANDDASVIAGQSGDGPARWTQSTGMVHIPPLTGYYGHANGISGDGSVIVGDSQTPNGPQVEAFRWTGQTGTVGLGFLPGGALSIANGVTPDGNTVVGTSEAQGGYYQPFKWTQQTGMVSLANEGAASAISRDGNVIVGSNLYRAVRWTPTGMEVLWPSSPPGKSSALACSGDGSVVVGYKDYSAQTSLERAWIWVQSEGAFDLRAYAVAHGVAVPNYILVEATGVSADGKLICGWADSASGGTAFVLDFRTETQINPTSTTLAPGIVVTGTPQNLNASDDLYYTLRPGVVLSSSQSPIVLTISGNATASTATSLKLRVESRAQQANIRQTVEAFNFTSNGYVVVNQQVLPTTIPDTTLTLPLTNPAQFIGPGNEVRARISYKAAGPILSYPWQVFLDETTWRYTP